MLTWVLVNTVSIFIEVINWLIIIRVLLSWIRVDYDNPLIRMIYQITEPILAPFRNLLMRSAIGRNLMVDFSPVIAILVLQYIVKPLLIKLVLFI